MRLRPPRRHVVAQPVQLQLQGEGGSVCRCGSSDPNGCRAMTRSRQVEQASAISLAFSCAASSMTVGLSRPPSHLSTSRPVTVLDTDCRHMV